MAGNAAYDTDFYAWTQEQARLLRQAGAMRVNLPLDFEYLAEEIADMGKSDKSAVQSAMARIIEHLLKLEYSSAGDPRGGWEDSVNVHRLQARSHLEDSPSLRGKIDLANAWHYARKFAARGLERDGIMADETLPADCPYSLEQVLDVDWWPINRHGLE